MKKVNKIWRENMKKIYHMKAEGLSIKEKDVQKIGEYIDSMGPNRDPKTILVRAKADKKCPINKYLEWDNKKAGEKWRLHQVRQIINHIEVEIISEGDSKPVKAFYSITDANTGKKYANNYEIQENVDYRKQIIDRAKKELEGWMSVYGRYEELKSITQYLKKRIK